MKSLLSTNFKIALRRRQAQLKGLIAYSGGPKSLQGATPALFIGGTGGSGTRALVSALRSAGFFIGTNLNPALDSLDVDRFLRRWLERYLSAGSTQVTTSQRPAMNRQFRRTLIWHRAGIASAGDPWLVKHPRTLLMLPYLASQCPEFRYIHIVRDGRDMVFSRNTQQAQRYADIVLPGSAGEAEHRRLMRFWAHTNLEASTFGREVLGQRYRLVRFEDLCSSPQDQLAALFNWLEVPETRAIGASTAIVTPASLGRWKSQPESLVADVMSVGRSALDTFGYTD